MSRCHLAVMSDSIEGIIGVWKGCKSVMYIYNQDGS